MNEGEIILKPIPTDIEKVRSDLLGALGMSENAKPEAVNAAVRQINELHKIYLNLQAEEKTHEKSKEIQAILSKLQSAPSLEAAQEIIENEYNLVHQKPIPEGLSSPAAIKIEPIGTFVINGQDYELKRNSGSEDKLIIVKSGDDFWQKP